MQILVARTHFRREIYVVQVVDVEKYYSELYENISFQLAPLCDKDSLAAADASFDQIINTRTEGGTTLLYCHAQ